MKQMARGQSVALPKTYGFGLPKPPSPQRSSRFERINLDPDLVAPPIENFHAQPPIETFDLVPPQPKF